MNELTAFFPNLFIALIFFLTYPLQSPQESVHFQN
nr:unnamed protein product [Callosobruchus chinensis]